MCIGEFAVEEQDLEYRFAFNFDLDEGRLKELYPAQTATGYKRAWSDIRSFMEANGGFLCPLPGVSGVTGWRCEKSGIKSG